MAVEHDIAVFYDTDVFGTSAKYTHSTTVKQIVVIFDRAGVVTQVGEIAVENAAPRARCKTADVSSAARGDTLLISGTTYYVIAVEPINTLETVLHLSTNS